MSPWVTQTSVLIYIPTAAEKQKDLVSQVSLDINSMGHAQASKFLAKIKAMFHEFKIALEHQKNRYPDICIWSRASLQLRGLNTLDLLF